MGTLYGHRFEGCGSSGCERRGIHDNHVESLTGLEKNTAVKKEGEDNVSIFKKGEQQQEG